MRASLVSVMVLAACEHGKSPGDAGFEGHIDPPPPAQLAADRQALDFGSVVIGSSSGQMAIQLMNRGQQTTGTITGLITGTSASDFTVTNGCTFLAPGGTCVMTVGFSPTTMGAKTATFVATSSPGGTVMVAVNGVGANGVAVQ